MNTINTNEATDVEIPYYDTPPTYQHFLQHHLIPNKPCVIGPSLTHDWKARNEWVVPTTAKDPKRPIYKPNYKYLRDRFGSAKGQVAKCNERHFSDQERKAMSFHDFTLLWERDDTKESLYYLKDCHLFKHFSEDDCYTVPYLFEDDWLNEYWKTKDDDYKFSYMGGHTTFTPLHADVYRSYSWSSNICGIKKWTFFPPGQEGLFKDKYGNMVYDIRRVNPKDFPLFSQAKRIILYQKDGETVFVPSGWFHQVENQGAAISINHNWCNATNLMYTYRSLKKDLNDCTRAILDIKDGLTELEFTQECQNLLLMHAGWNWKTFLNILHCVVHDRRISLVQGDNQPDLKWQMEKINEVLDQWYLDVEGGKEKLMDYFKATDDLLDKYNELINDISFILNN